MRRVAVAALVLLGLITACSDDASSPSAVGAVATTVEPTTTSAPPETVPATTEISTTGAPTTEVTTTTKADAPTTPGASGAKWEQVTAPSDCMCADGSPYSYWIHKADPTKVVFFLEGGGACVDQLTCTFGGLAYRSAIGAEDDPNGFHSGIFDFADARNPLVGYSFVFAPYCTGDVHIGNATHVYGPELTVQHKGAVNATTALEALAEQFPDTEQLLVTGESAGSVPTPLYAGLAHDLLPDSAITVLADGSGAYPDDPAVDARVGELWGTAAVIPPWPENEGLTVGDWSAPQMFVQAGKHDPNIIFGRHDYAFDFVQQIFTALVGYQATDLLTVIDANETQIEQGGVDLHSYIAPGQGHTVLSSPSFYTETVEGVRLVDWVSDLVARQPDLDVHCTDCTG